MKRRLNLAAALLHEPKIVLLDEPTAGVDPQSRNYILESIEKLQTQGLTVLYTTHYMEEAERLCDRVAIMDEGKVLAMDTIENLISAHATKSIVEAELSETPADTESLPGTLEGLQLRFKSAKTVLKKLPS